MNFFAIFARSKSVGMLFNLRGMKNFFFHRKCFPKVIAISEFQPSSGNLGLFFGDFCKRYICRDVI